MTERLEYIKNRLNKVYCDIEVTQEEYLVQLDLHITGKMSRSPVDEKLTFYFDSRHLTQRAVDNAIRSALFNDKTNSMSYVGCFSHLQMWQIIESKYKKGKNVLSELLKTSNFVEIREV